MFLTSEKCCFPCGQQLTESGDSGSFHELSFRNSLPGINRLDGVLVQVVFRLQCFSKAFGVLYGRNSYIYLLTAVGLSPGGSTHLHTNSTQNNTNNNRTTQITNNVEDCGSCPVFARFYSGICLTTEKKSRKNHSQDKTNLSQVNKNLSQSTVYILPRQPHITKPTQTHTLQNPHIHTHTHTQPHYKTI
jgi:hypothetical protein